MENNDFVEKVMEEKKEDIQQQQQEQEQETRVRINLEQLKKLFNKE